MISLAQEPHDELTGDLKYADVPEMVHFARTESHGVIWHELQYVAVVWRLGLVRATDNWTKP